MNAADITFVNEVPQDGRAGAHKPRTAASRLNQIVETLQQHPGQWARVLDGIGSPNWQTRLKQAGCEAKTRNRRPGERGTVFDVYARWPEGGAA
jgi:hypothetical protein